MKKTFATFSLIASVALSFVTFNAISDASSVEKNLRNASNGRFADAPIEVLGELPLKGFYEVMIGGQYLVVDESGSYAFLGGIIDLTTMENIAETRRNKAKAIAAQTAIKKLPEDIFVTYSPKGEVKGTVYVYSDPNCGYCKKVHKEVNQYLAAGIELKYIPYPIFGAKSVEQTRQMMCADNPEVAMTELMSGTDKGNYKQSNYPNVCSKLVDMGSESGRGLGITGTPYIYLSTGKVIAGYQEAEAIIQTLKKG
ncbi:MAG: DsbC family protein [Colwellia sp.]